jgi:hypothetical protein
MSNARRIKSAAAESGSRGSRPGTCIVVSVSLFEPLFDALNAASVRYVVVGGLATVLHGHARLTADIDLVVDLAPDEARKAVETVISSA